MKFPVVSTAVYTKRMRHANRVLQRTSVADRIRVMQVYNCKETKPDVWSAHARGDAGDALPKIHDRPNDLEDIARAMVRNAEKRTVANRGRRTAVVYVIVGQRQWVKDEGWSAYPGTPHVGHVHQGCSFSTTVRPKCAR